MDRLIVEAYTRQPPLDVWSEPAARRPIAAEPWVNRPFQRRRAHQVSSSASSTGGAGNSQGRWEPYAIELNLRKGGTTHPFLTLQFLTDGAYDSDAGAFRAPSGREKHLVATDHLESELLRGLTVEGLFDISVEHGLHFDLARQTGVVFHMMGSLTELGRVGMTAVGDDPEQAEATFQRAEQVLLAGAEPPPEPGLPAV